MDDLAFYRRRLREHILFYSLLGIFGILSIFSILLFFFIEPFSWETAWEDLLVTGVFIGIFLALLVIKIRIDKQRKEQYQNFLQLSHAEQAEIKAEVSTGFRQVLFGANRIYFSGFLSYVNYRDIVWIYPCSTGIPLVIPNGDIMLESSSPINAVGLVLWSRDGTHYKIPMGLNAWQIDETIAYIKEKAPTALIGYNKKRHKLAKKDFDRFLFEGRNIGP